VTSDEDRRRARAKRLRNEIGELTQAAKSDSEASPLADQPPTKGGRTGKKPTRPSVRNPRDFIEQRMRELDAPPGRRKRRPRQR
jgi:hypothetical protein